MPSGGSVSPPSGSETIPYRVDFIPSDPPPATGNGHIGRTGGGTMKVKVKKGSPRYSMRFCLKRPNDDGLQEAES